MYAYDVIMILKHRNSTKIHLYKEASNYTCANPYCIDGNNIEIHHIIPIKIGGNDRYWNYISLCAKCHKSLDLHRDWEFMIPILFSWKCKQELKLWGFTLDEDSYNYKDNIRKFLNIANGCI